MYLTGYLQEGNSYRNKQTQVEEQSKRLPGAGNNGYWEATRRSKAKVPNLLVHTTGKWVGYKINKEGRGGSKEEGGEEGRMERRKEGGREGGRKGSKMGG